MPNDLYRSRNSKKTSSSALHRVFCYWLNFEIVASLISMRKWFLIFITACDGVGWGEVKVFIYWRFDVFDSIELLNWRSDSSKYDECLAQFFNWHAIFVYNNCVYRIPELRLLARVLYRMNLAKSISKINHYIDKLRWIEEFLSILFGLEL